MIGLEESSTRGKSWKAGGEARDCTAGLKRSKERLERTELGKKKRRSLTGVGQRWV